MTEWREQKLSDFMDFNPYTPLSKGIIAKKVTMEKLIPFNRKIQGYEDAVFSGGAKFKNGDTLVARITPCLENGKTAYVDFLDDEEVAFGSTEFIVLRAKEGISDSRFIFYFAISDEFRDTAIQLMSGTSGRQRVDTEALKRKVFTLPPLPEQKAIAEVLSSLDDKIDLLTRQNKTLEDIAQAYFRKWFIEDASDKWEEKGLDEIADFLNGLPLQKYPYKTGNPLHVIKIKELNNGFTDSSDLCSADIPEQYIVHPGDVIFSWSGSLKVDIWKYGKGALNQHLFKVTSCNYPKWFYYFWIKYHLPEFKMIAESKATTMGHIQRRDLSNAIVLVPENQEINNMDNIMSPLIKKIEQNNAQILVLQKLRDTLLPKLISSEIRLKM
jgi:type I restriction enzyme S subunit